MFTARVRAQNSGQLKNGLSTGFVGQVSPPTIRSCSYRILRFKDLDISKSMKNDIRTCADGGAGSAGSVQTVSSWHTLPDGMRLEVLRCTPSLTAVADQEKPLVLFVHGSYHGAWCWAENFLPFLAEKGGYESIAVSLRAQGNSDKGDLKIAGTIETHVKDLESLISSLPKPPVVVGHSFGGLLVEAYCSLQGVEERPKIAGVALLSSVPPSGNKEIIARITKKSILTSLRITWAFITKAFARNEDSCKELFFSDDIPRKEFAKYQRQLSKCSPVGLLDVRKLSSELPLPSLNRHISSSGDLRAFVGGGKDDLVVDIPAVAEAASYFGVDPVYWESMAHDIMLDTRWRNVAGDLKDFLDTF